AGGPTLRPGGVFTAEAAQTGGILSTVWPADGGGRASLCWPALPPTARHLCPPDGVARAAEAADLAGPPDHLPAHRGPAAGALCHGRPALGRSDHAGAAHAPGRSRPHHPSPGALDLSTRLQPAVDGAFAPHPGNAAALTASSGGGDDGPGGTWQSPAPGGGRANRGQDRW